ncbi:CD209 antigen-like protein E [Salarias fasciatus]|uniref:CD209 antigen-like protein E n=1 Tax=Salarias fasciatus TaxID=181472 RepID=A0A672FXH3_SALFA|nr:CD209 antigen-like protein E [Salarias fasciatus]
MDRGREPKTFNSDFGFNTPICEEDLDDEEQLPYHKFSQDTQKVSTFSVNLGRHDRLAAVLLGLLAVALLMVNVGLGVHYNSLTDTHLTLEDTQSISTEIKGLQDTYKTAVETMEKAMEKKDTEMNRQKQTQWEFDHQTDRGQDYQTQMDKITKEIAKLRPHIPLIGDGCKYCPAGWILMNSMCFYFPFSVSSGVKSWQKSREYCQLYGGDLAVIDSKDKENATVTYLLNQQDAIKSVYGFWFGLKYSNRDGAWNWLDGTGLAEGYWDSGEPNNANVEDCAYVQANENFFKAWRDNSCRTSMKWICEKTPANIL